MAESLALEPVSASALLRAAARIYDASHGELELRARRAARRGFAGGAEWMRAALGELRGVAPSGSARSFQRLGLAKYSLAGGAAGLVLAAAFALEVPWIAPLAVLAFYLVEVRMVFAFPLALDGVARPLRASHRLVNANHGVWEATAVVMPLAAAMLVGGFLGRGFVRSWCLGCLAVLLWYESARATERAA